MRVQLIVIYSPLMEECRAFYESLGLRFATERHGDGPKHYAAVLDDGMVFEIYPASRRGETGALRLGFTLDGRSLRPPLPPGRHLLTDPDGRTVELATA
ncbi:glyoxalase/bleomycin resistance/dioxygenase family protein [Actinomadura gamaensis]|uniref:Glyoxalase/bleomycin resistance/dioxygenase family protein n=1 Tax=Actinomadura gamaensis TaxID=1763541 RepID=A0ABV9U3A5_9ACTN